METKRAVLWIAVSSEGQAGDEKDSLPNQQRDAEALCKDKGWAIVSRLTVPGFSRDYIDLGECADDMAAQGITAFHDLMRLWDTSPRPFDVFVCRGADRFGRTQTLVAHVVEKIISIGAVIWSMRDGLIDDKNFRMFIAMAGYKASVDIDNLVKLRSQTLDGKVHRGAPISTSSVMSHSFLRDPQTGKRTKIVVNEELRHIWPDVAALLLARVGWRDMEQELFQRFEHGNARGEAYHMGRLHTCLTNPVFWGHNVRGHRRRESPGGWARVGPWMWEEGHEIPEGVIIQYNTHEPVYTGELAERVKAELFRRYERGHKGDYKSFRFSGLVVCGECGYYMICWNERRALKCMTKYDKSVTRRPCTQRQFVDAAYLEDWLDKRIREAVDTGDLDSFFNVHTEPSTDLLREISRLETEIAEQQTILRRLIRKQATVDEDLAADFDAEIQAVGKRRSQLEESLHALKRQEKQRASQESDQRRTLDELRRLSVDGFWQRPDPEINQVLLRLFGKKRLAALHGQIVGFVDAPGWNRRS